MKITILGTAPGKSLLGKSHTAFLLEDTNNKFLIDCGEGTTQKILEKNIAGDELDGIIISHLHPDHVSGIFMLMQTLYLNKRKKDLFIFLPESVEEFKAFLNTIYIFNARLSYDINIQLYNEDSFSEIGVYPFKNTHLIGYKGILESAHLQNTLLSYSFIIKSKTKSLLLTSDIRSADDIKEYIDKCEVVVLDGIHPSYQPIEDLLKGSNKEVYITHGDYSYLQEKFAEILGKRIKLAKENDEIIL